MKTVAPSTWIMRALELGEGKSTKYSNFVADTRPFTGRAVKHRYIINSASLENQIAWGSNNQKIERPLGTEILRAIKAEATKSAQNLYHGFVGPFAVQVQSTSHWHMAFCQNMFRSSAVPLSEQEQSALKTDQPIRIFHLPKHKLTQVFGQTVHSQETIIVVDAENYEIGICGTSYAGEIKKSAFAMANLRLPEAEILPMHASANCLPDGSSSCVLFGLSGTGKTTLSATADRALIGDDEIIWTQSGLWNLEGGCYAKLIDLTEDKEPEIFSAVTSPRAILENVQVKADGSVDFFDRSYTENTRGSYPLASLKGVYDQTHQAQAPQSIVFLTADAFGALPAVAKLDPRQAQYYFLSGYTARVAGTELGVVEPQAVFSTCFGAPFMPLHPHVYADLLKRHMDVSGAEVWLLNTGWQMGGYGKADRFPLKVSRKLLSAIQNGQLGKQKMSQHPVFGFRIPTSCEGVESKYLAVPQGDAVLSLAKKFVSNFEAQHKHANPIIAQLGGPKL